MTKRTLEEVVVVEHAQGEGAWEDIVQYLHEGFLDQLPTTSDLSAWHRSRKLFASQWKDREYARALIKRSRELVGKKYDLTKHGDYLRFSNNLLGKIVFLEIIDQLVEVLPSYKFMQTDTGEITTISYTGGITSYLGKEGVRNNSNPNFSVFWKNRTKLIFYYMLEHYGWHYYVVDAEDKVLDLSGLLPKESRLSISLFVWKVGDMV